MHKFLSALLLVLFANTVFAADSLTASQRIAAQGMQVQSERLKVISQNIANSNTTGLTAEDTPYKRKVILFKNDYDPAIGASTVKVDRVAHDKSEFIKKYEPYHPASDEGGYVKYPNVNIPLETVDAKEAQRSYEANLSSLEIAKSNQARIIDAMR
jgi:flagellar basal-body rod protein FlgC